MKAAAPRVPPHLVPVRGASGTWTGRVDETAQDMATSQSNGEEPRRQARPLRHVKDIAARAESKVNPDDTFGRLLELAERSLSQSRSILEWRGRLDLAYEEYLVAVVVLGVLARHRYKPLAASDNPNVSARYNNIIKKVNAEQDSFDRVRDDIIKDNQRYATQPGAMSRPTSQSQPQSQPQHAASSDRPSTVYVSSPPSEFRDDQSQRNSFATSGSTHSRPPIHPKPLSLQSDSIVPNGAPSGPPASASNDDALLARFAKVRRAPGAPTSSDERQYVPTHTYGHIADYADVRPMRPQAARTSSRPLVNTSKDLPKPPSPTYSPVRGPSTLQTGQHGTNARDSIVTNGSTSSSITSSHSVTYSSVPNGYTAQVDVSKDENRVESLPLRRRRRSSGKPQETEISAEQLYDFTRHFNVLLIDVRSREEFDQGHIFAKACICVEPTALRSGQSAEDLFDSLVLSPESEQSLFDHRDEFDIVVYFDNSTANTSFLSSQGLTAENAPLRYLHDALSDFNQEKPLRRRPILLLGGMDAWIDLLGHQALQTSNTAARAREQQKSSRPIARRPLALDSAKLNLQKKRHRDYNPLEPEEEKKWRERARSESIVLDQLPQPTQDAQETEPEEDREAYVKNMDDFYKRFPSVAAVEKQSMTVSPPPNRPLPNIPSQVPSYPTMPLPTEPSRPQPIASRPSYSGVSAKITSNNLDRQRSAQLAPYIPPKLKRLPRTGLHNFGVTCYMNATIQCLSATIPLTAFFLDGQYAKCLQRENWKGSKGLMPELYNILLRNLWQSNDADTIRPTNFRKFCARLNREWGIDRQQDAKEFLEFLVDTLHEDLNFNWARNPLRALTAGEEAERERTPQFVAARREWQRYLHRDCSRLTDLFAGQHISRLQCTTCKHSSTTYEAFYSISIEIPRPASRNGSIDIHDCLRSYCSAEMLSGDELWRCPHCKTEREASKRITITRAPEFLVVHFKRFSAGHAEKARKVHTPIDFPLTGLDLEPYVLPSPDQAQADVIAKRYGATELANPPRAMTPPYRYDAYAVMRHLGGTMTSGHYISLVQDKARGCWREFNDDRVTDFLPDKLPHSKRLQNEQAYIVFYQRVFA